MYSTDSISNIETVFCDQLLIIDSIGSIDTVLCLQFCINRWDTNSLNRIYNISGYSIVFHTLGVYFVNLNFSF